MPQFRKKPVTIEAHQLTRPVIEAHIFDGHELPFGLRIGASRYHKENRILYDFRLSIDTLEGQMEAKENDWIIKGVKGELYPCKPDIFEATYEPV